MQRVCQGPKAGLLLYFHRLFVCKIQELIKLICNNYKNKGTNCRKTDTGGDRTKRDAANVVDKHGKRICFAFIFIL